MAGGCDLRLESTAGRGRLAPAEAVRAAAAAGIRVAALADWGTGAGLSAATDAALAAGVALLPAVTVAARDGDAAVEVVAYGCDGPPVPIQDPPRVALADAVHAIRAAGGVAGLAGPLPADPEAAAARLVAASNAGAGAAEVWHPAHGADAAAGAAALAARLDLVPTGTGAGVPADAWRPLVARWLDGPLLILVGGEVATGKSRVARQVAAWTGARHVSSDALREELFPLAAVGREAKYGAPASAAVFRILALEAEHALRDGRAVLCDAVLRGRAVQADLVARARARGARVVAIACECAEAEQRLRLRARRPGADHFSEAGEPVLDLLRAREREAPAAYAAFPQSPELAGADALVVADSTPGAAPARLHGARTPLATWFATALAARLC